MNAAPFDRAARGASDVWATAAAYEPYIGRWSRLVAREFIPWLNVRPDARWIDVGCGTGALTETILDLATPRQVEGVDSSPEYIGYARSRIEDARASFRVSDARSLPQADRSADAAVSALALNFIPDQTAAVREMLRVVARRTGIVAAYVWDYAGRMELIRYFWDAAAELDPAAAPLDEGVRFPTCNAASLTDLFTLAGLSDVETRPIDAPTRFRDFDDYWSPFLGGQGPAPGYAMRLSSAERGRLRDRIRDRLSIQHDGSIELVARAWAVRGRSP